jgi:hypothetical protein
MTGRAGDDAGAREREERLRAIVPLLKQVEGEVELVLHGVSMEPTIPDGSMIRIRCRDPHACSVGDIVVMRAESGVVAHRVFHRGRRGAAAHYLLTRGDARWVPDAPVPVASLLGIVTGVTRGGTWTPPPPAIAPGWVAAVSAGVLRSMLEFNLPLARAVAGGLALLRRGYRRLRRLARSAGDGRTVVG